MSSLVLMDPPERLIPKAIHDKKVIILKKMSVVSEKDITLGQYESYAKELGKRSKTETYAEVRLNVNSQRWKGTPIILSTGKKLKEKKAYIEIEFKKNPCMLYCNRSDIKPNKLIINIQPTQDIIFEMNIPNSMRTFDQKNMSFCHSCAYGANSVQAYEKLLSDSFKDDKTLFTRFDELKESWKITDRIRSFKNKIHKYKDGSNGPKGLIH
jgi:glucose-6-phosphate 1-dehydrogenase